MGFLIISCDATNTPSLWGHPVIVNDSAETEHRAVSKGDACRWERGGELICHSSLQKGPLCTPPRLYLF